LQGARLAFEIQEFLKHLEPWRHWIAFNKLVAQLTLLRLMSMCDGGHWKVFLLWSLVDKRHNNKSTFH